MNSSVAPLAIACRELDLFFGSDLVSPAEKIAANQLGHRDVTSSYPENSSKLGASLFEASPWPSSSGQTNLTGKLISTQSPPRRKVRETRDSSPAPRTHAGRKQCGLIADSAGKIGSSFPPSTSSPERTR